jgi:hypothetical protein
MPLARTVPITTPRAVNVASKIESDMHSAEKSPHWLFGEVLKLVR